MCKCLQYCFESCYWHLIEKRFCYDESIALYEVPPDKNEKNNNSFDNVAFYDSVAVIAGRAVVTIDPQDPVIRQQPTRRLRWEEQELSVAPRPLHRTSISRSVPIICELANEEELGPKDDETDSRDVQSAKLETLRPENLETRRKSLKDRRLSKSLYLKIDQPKEIPIIRQQSMPKFYLDTPDDADHSLFRSPSTALTSPVPKSSAFVYDLYSVVQMERQRVHQSTPVHRKESDRASRLMHIKDKIKLRRVKSSLGNPVTNLPHSHHHI